MKIEISLNSNIPAPVQYWRVLHNPDVPTDGRPDVVFTADDEKNNNVSAVPMTEAIQRLAFDLFCWGVGDAIPVADRGRKWRMLYSENLAFTNTAGFEGDPPRWDYINNLDAGAELPILQKGITIAGAKVTGRVVGNYLEMDTLSPANVPTLEWLIARPHLYFEAMNVNEKGQSRFPQAGGNSVLVPWFCQAGKVARLSLDRVERML